MNTNHLDRFEEIVQRLVEGTFARLFAGRLRPLEVANALAHALEDHAVSQPNGLALAPNRYWVALNPADHEALLAEQPDLADDLARHLIDLAHQAGFDLPAGPMVELTPQPDVALHRVQVTARWQPPDEKPRTPSDSTLQMMRSTRDVPGAGQAASTRPFLILEGQRHIPLSKNTVSLGRSLDNDVIVDDARVSRQHAQLQRRYDHYVIYDLGSTGGTAVNGYPVQECILEAGDVISLAGVELIYGEDTPAPAPFSPDVDNTPALPRSYDWPTVDQVESPGTDELPRPFTDPSEN